MRSVDRQLSNRTVCLVVAAAFILSRCIYYWAGVRFDMAPLQFYIQIIDPVLLRDALWQSLFYLRTQPPGFNLFVGAVMHVSPGHLNAAFHATYLILGLILAVSLSILLNRMLANSFLAAVIAIVFVVSPVTVLYENLLFYEYPLAVLFCLAALFLHRYATGGRKVDGIALFTALAAIGLTRVVFHLVWFALIVSLLLYVLPLLRRRTLLCAVMPAAVLSIVYVKSLIVFGLLTPGSDVYAPLSFAGMNIPPSPDPLLELVRKGTVSPILLHFWDFENPALLKVVPLPPRTGVPILDERLKSSGRINADSLWMAAVGKQVRKDDVVLLCNFPKVALRTVFRNIKRFCLPADSGWPFDGREDYPNKQALKLPLKVSDSLTAGKLPGSNHPFLSYLMTPFLLSYGIRRLTRKLKLEVSRPAAVARNLVIGFAVGNIVYFASVMIFLNYADQNRYRFEMSTLFVLLFGLWSSSLVKEFRRSRMARASASASSLTP